MESDHCFVSFVVFFNRRQTKAAARARIGPRLRFIYDTPLCQCLSVYVCFQRVLATGVGNSRESHCWAVVLYRKFAIRRREDL